MAASHKAPENKHTGLHAVNTVQFRICVFSCFSWLSVSSLALVYFGKSALKRFPASVRRHVSWSRASIVSPPPFELHEVVESWCRAAPLVTEEPWNMAAVVWAPVWYPAAAAESSFSLRWVSALLMSLKDPLGRLLASVLEDGLLEHQIKRIHSCLLTNWLYFVTVFFHFFGFGARKWL